MIRDEAQLRTVAERVGDDLQDIENYLRAHSDARARVSFPSGFIRPAYYFREKLWFIQNETLKRNLGYSLILLDVLRWALDRLPISV